MVPSTPGFYAKTPLQKKLGIQESVVVTLLGAPGGFDDTLGKLPPGVRVKRRVGGTADLVMLFVRARTELDKRFAAAVRTIADGGSMWIVWPKKASGVQTDVNGDTIRAAAIPLGLVEVKVCAVDDVWSGLKLVIRKENRV